MKIALGSNNPVKVNAAISAFKKYYPDVEVIAKEVESYVSSMPKSREETIAGAINRAKAAYDASCDYSVGLEGGVEDTQYGMMLFGWAAIMDKQGKIGVGNAGHFLLPEHIARKIRQGHELGPLMDELTNSTDVKRKGGAIGYFTKSVISRTDSFKEAIILALARFINEDIYNE